MNIKRNGIRSYTPPKKDIDLKYVPLDLEPNEVGYTRKIGGICVDLVLRNDYDTNRDFDSTDWKKIKR